MHFTFLAPNVLWLLLFLPLLWLLTWSATQSTAASRTPSARTAAAPRGRSVLVARVVLRSVIFAALVLALAGAQLVRPVDDLTVVFLVDGSDSVSPAQREQAISYINSALGERRPNDQAAVVVFGSNALVEWAPADLATLTRLTSTPIASRTNIEEAIRLGLALFPADTQKRLVLLSDGSENNGRAFDALQFAASEDVPLDVVPLPRERGPDVLLSALDAPDTAREGQDVTLQASIESSFATSGQLQIFVDNELVGTQDVTIDAGRTDVPLTVPAGDPDFHRYEVRLEAEGDTQPINNRAAAFTTVQGPPRVLLVASDPDRAAPLQRSLEAASARVDVRTPQQVPADQARLRQFAAVILVDVLAREVPRAVQEALPVYVREQGGALAMIGGRESFGAGGWRRSPLEAALPVALEPLDRSERPDVALVLVIDRSGSMSSFAGMGVTKLDLAKEAVHQSSLGLEQGDQIGVVGFDALASWVLDVQPLPSLADIEQALTTFNADGGTNIRAGIEPAAEALTATDARTKHVILLTDGLADSNYADLIAEMQRNGVTISVVSIGPDANPALTEIAELGGGRFYRVERLAEVPNIFLSETVIVAGRDIVEGQFGPAIALPAPVVRGLGGLPPLYGYNATEPRATARTILVTPDGKPVLAQWQYGLGRSVAWTSDLKGQWARDWVAWEGFPRFVGGLLDMLLPPEQTAGLALDSRSDGARTVLDLTVQNSEGVPLEDAQIEARLLDPQNTGAPLAFEQIGVGRYRAEVETDEPGVYLAQVAVQDENGDAVGTVARGLAVAYSPEYRPARVSDATGVSPLLGELARATEGQRSPAPTQVFTPLDQAVGIVEEIAMGLLWLALLLWPLDIALRRLLLRGSDVSALRGAVGQRIARRRAPPAAAPAEATVARLQQARRRVQRPGARLEVPPPAPAPREQPQPGAPPTPPPPSRPAPPPDPTPPVPSRPSAQAQPREDALASLLAARKRARRQRREQQD